MESWLKKYTRLEFLEIILKEEQLHLGDPALWTDKNDSELIQIYTSAAGFSKTRSTCLTMAPDRYHFWALFGEESKGVCLWFDRRKLLADIANDNSLRSGLVQYLKPSGLSGVKLHEIPFVKRAQYTDEQEFRVIRNFKSTDKLTVGLRFSPSSLIRIYLNAWLSDDELNLMKAQVGPMLKQKYGHVRLLQSKMLRYERWIDAAKNAAHSSSEG